MSEQTTPSRLQTGIYDLGYRSYEGPRLGRLYAVLSLFTYSLRSVFGLGSTWVAKLFAMGLATIALIPCLVLLAIAAITPEDVDFVPNYFDFIGFGFVGTVLTLFGAVTAPELIGKDQRHKTMALYFSRSLSRTDYVTAKLAALTCGVMFVVMVPQLLLLLGNAVATNGIVDYLTKNLDDLPLIVANSALIGITVSSITMAIACQTPRRAWGTGAVIIYFVMTTALGAILLETVSGNGASYTLLVSPIAVLQGAAYWILGDALPATSDVAKADLDGVYYLAASAIYTLFSIAVLYRRFLKMSI
jgi:ABC-2 type transport system permease protein